MKVQGVSRYNVTNLGESTYRGGPGSRGSPGWGAAGRCRGGGWGGSGSRTYWILWGREKGEVTNIEKYIDR